MNLYTFFRADGFYPLELENDAVAKSCAAINPGTLKVIRQFPKPVETIWNALEFCDPDDSEAGGSCT